MAVRALIADGSRSVRNAIRFHLECVGCEVVAEVGSAAQALQLFRTVRPDVVALGLDLPCVGETSPLSLFREIRRDAPDTAIMVLNGTRDATANLDVYLREGALDCIAGPFGSQSFDLLWRRLSGVYPELRRHGFGARASQMPNGQSRGQNRQMA